MFKLLDRYLIREIVPYFLLSLVLLTAIIFAQEASRFSELIVVASRSGLPMQTLGRIMTALFPGILVFTLPVSMLMGTLVGLGRLSGDSEIVALGASGMSRWRMLRPVVLLSVVVGAAMVYITFNVLPRSVRLLADLKQNQTLVFQGLNSEIKPRVFEESIPQKVLFIEEIDRARNLWHNIFLVDLGNGPNDMKIMTATEGSLRQGERSDMPELYLKTGTTHQITTTRPEASDSQDQREANGESVVQRQESGGENRERRRNRNEQTYTAQQFDEVTIGLEVPDDKRTDVAGVDREAREVEEMAWSDLLAYTPGPDELREWLAEIHKRLALPAACLVFALLGVGFGISNVRTGRSFGLILGLVITIVYYLLALWGQHAAVLGKTPEWFGIWMANLLLSTMGILIILLQRRPGSDPLSAVSRVRHAWHLKQWVSRTLRVEPLTDTETTVPGTTRELPVPSRRRRLAQLLDTLVLTDLTRFFLFILTGFGALFLIITLFQLLDSITRNNIDWTTVASYLFFLLPFVVNNVTPLAALVAVMVTFGILQKTSQVVALKASGQSIYRMAVPAVAGSLLLSAGVFLNQDYIMPFTNPRQNNLRYLIRKGQEPPQTFYQTTNQWVFGIDSRIFNYSHLDPKTNSFARLNVLDLSGQSFGIARRIYAKRASWNPETQRWVLEGGWERRFDSSRLVAFEPFREREYDFQETPDYFKKDSRGSSSLTIRELRDKIADLSRSGFDVRDLRIALQGKIAFPLTCTVMVLVGLPFSFSVGKRGALYGVALGIAIGLAYWGLQGLFEQMGRYELLPPVLAAWGPNLLFGAGGLYLFLHSST